MEIAIIWLILVVGLFYVLLWRPQQRRITAVRSMQAALRAGDEVMTTSGMFGRIVALHDDTLDLEIAPGTVIRLARGAVGERIADGPGEPGADPEAG